MSAKKGNEGVVGTHGKRRVDRWERSVAKKESPSPCCNSS